MFNNRPALKKDMPIQMAENQKKFADLEKDFSLSSGMRFKESCYPTITTIF